MTPYYQEGGVTLYRGDAREILPILTEPVEAVIVDPVWPNAVASLSGSDDPKGLFDDCVRLLPDGARRLVVHLGCDSDPRFLSGLDARRWPFLRALHLRYSCPHYKGRMLYTHDVAYSFGEYPPPKKGRTVIPGEFCQTHSARRTQGHPCPRRLQHVAWLVRFWAGEGPVLDFAAGSGATLLACKEAGIPAVGIEISREFCDLAISRLGQHMLFSPTAEPQPPAKNATPGL